MKALNNTPENNAKLAALKNIKETQWVGELTFDTIDKCLTSMNIYASINSGWYKPNAIKIKGLNGIFMINEDGSVYFEQRVIKTAEGKYKIEHLSDSGYEIFEKSYFEFIEA